MSDAHAEAERRFDWLDISRRAIARAAFQDGAQWRDENPRPGTEEDVEAAAKAYWLASQVEIWGEREVAWDWDDSERQQFMWAARTVLDAVTARHTKEPDGT